jgi:hypothetical protein
MRISPVSAPAGGAASAARRPSHAIQRIRFSLNRGAYLPFAGVEAPAFNRV